MFALIVTEKNGTPKRVEFDKDEVTIGRVPGNDVILPKGNVSKRHSRVVRQDGRFFVVDLKSTNGTYLNGRRITTPSVIRPGDKIYVGDFVVSVEMSDGAVATAPPDVESPPIEAGSPMGVQASPMPASNMEPPPPLPVRGTLGLGHMPSPSEGSIVEPLPLDEEPAESMPPPSPSPRMQTGGLGAPPPSQRGLMTQPLGSGPLPSPGPASPATSPPNRDRGTQPPPRPSGAALPGRVSSAALSAQGMPNRTLGGAGPMRAPGSHQTGGGPLGGNVVARAPVGANGGASVPAASEARRTPSPVLPAAAPIEAQDPTPPPAVLTPPPVLPPSSAGVSTGVPTAATVNIAPAVVEAVIQSHKAATSLSGLEPTPPGREYAALLAELIAEARGQGVSTPNDRVADAATRASVRTAVEAVVRRRAELPPSVTSERLVRDATAELAGTGAIESALEEADVTTVVVDASGRVLVGRGDALGPSPFWFSSGEALGVAVDRLLAQAGRTRGEDAVVDTTFDDGARLIAVLAPLAAGGPTAVYERPASRPASLIELAARDMLSTAAVTLLGQALAARRNVLVTGPRGSGRSTVLAALVASVSATDRCVLVEDGRELGRGFPHVTALDARGNWKRALDLAQRLRPQRLVLAGGDDPAAAGVLLAGMSTGAEGALAKFEGASPLLALGRLATQAAAAGAMSREEAFVRIAATRPLIVHTARFGDGACRVVSIAEVRASEGGGLQIDEVFALQFDGPAAPGRLHVSLAPTGVVPSFAEPL